MKCMVVLAAVLGLSLAASPFSSSFRGSSAPLRSQPPLRPAAPQAPVPRRQVYASASAVSSVGVVPRGSSNDQQANIVRYESELNPDGSYNYAYETDNGISAQEQGTPRDFGGNPPLVPVVAQGSFAYTSPEGQVVQVSYVADENGFQPSGDSIPTPPPIPPQILRALDWIARNPQSQ